MSIKCPLNFRVTNVQVAKLNKKWSSLVQVEDHLILHSLVVVGNDLVVVPHKVMGFNQDIRTLAGDVVNDLHKEPLN